MSAKIHYLSSISPQLVNLGWSWCSKVSFAVGQTLRRSCSPRRSALALLECFSLRRKPVPHGRAPCLQQVVANTWTTGECTLFLVYLLPLTSTILPGHWFLKALLCSATTRLSHWSTEVSTFLIKIFYS